MRGTDQDAHDHFLNSFFFFFNDKKNRHIQYRENSVITEKYKRLQIKL